jgi:hypothetical protein
VLGAIVTFFLYGVGPLALVMYLVGTPMRRQARRAREAASEAQALSEPGQPDASGLAPRDPVAPERKEA